MKLERMHLTGVCLLLTALSFSAQAEIYKWTDANGVIQYTQTPPPDPSKAKDIQQEIDLSSGTSHKQSAPANAPDDEPDPALAEAKATGIKKADEHRNFCAQQKSALAQLMANPVIRWKSSSDEEHILTAKERSEKIAEFEKSLKEMCNKDVLPEKPLTAE